MAATRRRPPVVIDQGRLLAAVRALRAERGACTYRALAERLELDPRTVHRACKRLLDAGLLEAPGGGGSLRPVPRSRQRQVNGS